MKKFNVVGLSVALVTSLSIILGLVAVPSWAGIGKLNVAPSGQLQGGQLLPPSAMPRGLSLSDMALANALFVTSGNNPEFLPSTPFQFLYYDPATFNASIVGSGIVQTGSKTFTVREGTMFYVPIANVDDSPPILGGAFPTSHSAAVSYFFDSSQCGNSSLIVVDGQTTSVGPSYLVGPITTPPLLDVPPGTPGGTHMIALGVFLTPLSKGTHTISIKTRFDGAFIAPAISFDFLQAEFTYTVIVE